MTKHLTVPLIEADRERGRQARCAVDADVLRRQPGAPGRGRQHRSARSTRRSPKRRPRSRTECVSPFSSDTARSRSWRAARRSSPRTANRSSCARSRRAAAFAIAIASGARRSAIDRARCSGCTRRRSAKGCRRARCSSCARRSGPTLQLAYTYLLAERASVRARARRGLRATTCRSTRAGDARVALDALRPTALVFSKLDVWPVLAREARRARRSARAGERDAVARLVAPRRGIARRAAARRVRGARRRRRDRRGGRGPPRRSSACGRDVDRRHRRHALRPGVGARAARRPREPAARSGSRNAPADARRRIDVAGRRGGRCFPRSTRVRNAGVPTRG